jgi:hypothetical protein
MYSWINEDRNESEADVVQWPECWDYRQAAEVDPVPQIIAQYEKERDVSRWYPYQADAAPARERAA